MPELEILVTGFVSSQEIWVSHSLVLECSEGMGGFSPLWISCEGNPVRMSTSSVSQQLIDSPVRQAIDGIPATSLQDMLLRQEVWLKAILSSLSSLSPSVIFSSLFLMKLQNLWRKYAFAAFPNRRSSETQGSPGVTQNCRDPTSPGQLLEDHAVLYFRWNRFAICCGLKIMKVELTLEISKPIAMLERVKCSPKLDCFPFFALILYTKSWCPQRWLLLLLNSHYLGQGWDKKIFCASRSCVFPHMQLSHSQDHSSRSRLSLLRLIIDYCSVLAFLTTVISDTEL